ncbi:MAG: redox-regulated ATPase YchF [Actinomycetota bacterium]|uniref:OBG-type G domain-containing protein n=1 Tax=marine metagenome TaxID=408172 RepID=A0A381Q075_9ZZZZ|nr:redox-regulated ATPase YchF [Acidimicrobiales bacterium]MEC8921230.1 redox-regulated ATPase YchF [Actinomycetota bacterium]MEC9315607.1 redox-regulated ATPase YchF [Actinomycetota bacterium]MEE3188228.1 redox-regulated ATPase YchF [Actinomycetota bacterium]|tara:strand:+ start:3851 stop:4933 length:1083 start_codon:yes stop_codon:yes gene_type:complete
MERFGFVGLPNAGKSSLFNALAGGGALAAPYAFATTDPNVGVVKVPDYRLDALAAMSSSQKVVYSTTEFVDIGGLVEGASQGEGLGNKFLAGIREVDALVFVLRAFDDEDVPGPTEPLEHLRVVEIELTLADLESVESRIERRRKALRADPRDPNLVAEVDALEVALNSLSEGTPLFRAELSDERRAALREHFLLTNKPVMAVLNIGEDQLEQAADLASEIDDALPGAEVLPLSVQLEAEAAVLPTEDRTELLEGLGLGEGALPLFVRSAHGLLGLHTFLTTGEKESRAWTFKNGWKAPQCAGRIHTDFERGFIRAEVIEHDVLLDLGSWSAARDAGRLRLEGKDYRMQDGDVVEFRFNV